MSSVRPPSKKCGKSGENYASTKEQITGRATKEKRDAKEKMKTGGTLLKWNANPSWKLHRPRTNKRHSFRPRLNIWLLLLFTLSLGTSIAGGTIASYLPIFSSSFAFLSPFSFLLVPFPAILNDIDFKSQSKHSAQSANIKPNFDKFSVTMI